jgi:zinc protease
MLKRVRMVCILVLATLATSVHTQPETNQPDLGQPVPFEPLTRRGVLENGLTYYVRHNEEPKERATFYLVHNVGAIVEEDDQNGLAHFLEHMALNGTRHFPGKGIINTLERHGIAFGRNLNAYTSFDETVYFISNVPVTDPALLDTCLLILYDWCNYVLLEEEEIEKERGVIREEYRTRRDAGFRIMMEMLDHALQGSKYAERDVIGNLDVIENCDHESLSRFYHDWYRTDLQAVIVVGDFDEEAMEAKIRDLFSEIPAVRNPKPRMIFPVPEHEEPVYGLVTESEATSSSVIVYHKHKGTKSDDKNLEYHRQTYVHWLYNEMLGKRISEILRKDDPPFVSAYSYYGGFLPREVEVYNVGIDAFPNEGTRGLEAIMIENERVKRHGFTPSELDRAKANLLKSVESRYKSREKLSNNWFCRRFSSHYLTGAPVPGVEYNLEFVRQMLPTVSLEEINSLARLWMTEHNRAIIVTGPEKEGLVHLTRDEALAVIDRVGEMDIEPYVDAAAGSELLAMVPSGGEIVKSEEIPGLDAVEWTLSNGMKVIFRHSELNKDQLVFSAYSPGGYSLVPTEHLPSAQMASSLVGGFGVGDLDAAALEKVLAGKRVFVTPVISGITEGFRGRCSPDDFETMLQLIYLYLEEPRFDETAFGAAMQRQKGLIDDMRNDPEKTVQDSIRLITTGYHPRVLLVDMEYLERVDLEMVEKIYRDRYSDAGDFYLFFVGNVEVEKARPLIEKYLGGVKDLGDEETWVDHQVDMPPGRKVRTINVGMNVPKAEVYIKYGNDLEYTPANSLHLGIVREILNLRYVDTIREEEGGTYGVAVTYSHSHYPRERAYVRISFDCDPAKASELRALVYEEIDRLKSDGPDPTDLDNVIKNFRKQREERMARNGFWLNVLRSYYYHGINFADPENFEDILDATTLEEVGAAARHFFEGADLVEITFLPE